MAASAPIRISPPHAAGASILVPTDDPTAFARLRASFREQAPQPTAYQLWVATLAAEAAWCHSRYEAWKSAAWKHYLATHPDPDLCAAPRQSLMWSHLYDNTAFRHFLPLSQRSWLRFTQIMSQLLPGVFPRPRRPRLTASPAPASPRAAARSARDSWGFAQASQSMPPMRHRRALRLARRLAAPFSDPILCALVEAQVYYGEWRRYLDHLEARFLSYALWANDGGHGQAALWLFHQGPALRTLNRAQAAVDHLYRLAAEDVRQRQSRLNEVNSEIDTLQLVDSASNPSPALPPAPRYHAATDSAKEAMETQSSAKIPRAGNSEIVPAQPVDSSFTHGDSPDPPPPSPGDPPGPNSIYTVINTLGTHMRALAIALFFLTGTVHGAAAPDFKKDIRPILSDNCFQCHGNDRTTRMAGLRLDTRDGAFTARKNGTPIVPGNPTKSLILQRITAKDPARRMPPPFAHKTLTPAQIDTLAKWIQAGAAWQEHWAFTAPVRPALPTVRNTSWPRNPIDRFILARLEQNGLAPAPEAGRRTLIRRLSLDLTGLPPDPADVEAFAASTDPKAYDALIEKYLASPRYGEQRARFWLDAARYGDTHGIHIDNYREIWPYRDWVIRAYNANMPFDRFTLEQLAGDLLPNPTLEQRIATGFQRCNATTNEAGVIIDEIEAMYAKDRADTIGAVYLGLTVGCATCHDHKFDPIPQKDFYAMTAFFRNTTQNAMDGNVFDTPPIAVVPRPEDRPSWDAIEAREKVLRALLNSSPAHVGQAARPAAGLQAGQSPQQSAGTTASVSIHSPSLPSLPPPSGRGHEAAKAEAQAPPPGRDLLRLSLNGAITAQTQAGTLNLPFPEGLTLGGTNHPNQNALYFRKASLELPNIPEIDTNTPFSVSTTFFYPKGEEYYLIAAQQDPKDKGRGWNLFVSARIPGARFYFNAGKSIEIRAGHLDQLVPGTWNTLEMHYDGTGEALGVRLVINGREVNPQRNSRAKFDGSIRNGVPLKLGNPTRPEDGAIAELRIYQPTLSPEEAELHQLELEKREIRRRGAITLVMEERTDQKPFAHRLYRGMYDAPRERLDANTPSVLPPMAPELPRNRLGLAQWLTSPEHPLTARVNVNRYWQEIFGTGLVKTSEDFGSQGEAPVNQELLDWLAVEFRESGWDTKHMMRLLVSSAAYRQSAEATPDKLEKDPQNRLLSRGPRFRLDGETIRDTALAASGLLVPAIGGPSVKPYQPDGIWEAVAMDGSDTRFYKQDHGDSLYRRSLYTFWKRSAPPASMEIFNAPTRETCTVRRERTNTPLQALVVMNDPQFVEAARALAARAMASPGIDTQLNDISERLLSRPLEPKELDILKASYKDFLRYYDSNPAEAKKLIAVGESKPPENLNAPELASMTMVANQLLNLDEALNK